MVQGSIVVFWTAFYALKRRRRAAAMRKDDIKVAAGDTC
jgi:hypothetical protein